MAYRPKCGSVARERRLKTIDATCPLVTKVHLEAVRFAKQGYKIILIGHAGHDEVIGTMGEAPDAFVLVDSTDEVDRLEFPPGTRLAYLTQTTLSVDDANRIIRRLKERFPEIIGPPKEDICYATQNRQEAVRMIAAEADIVLVLGSQNSSNSQRLAELARETGVRAYLIDGPGDVDANWFTGNETVLITAGASALNRSCRRASNTCRNVLARLLRSGTFAKKKSISRCRANSACSRAELSADRLDGNSLADPLRPSNRTLARAG